MLCYGAGMARKTTRQEEARQATASASTDKNWTFLSNHGHVLIFLAQDPTARVRDIAQKVGITERSAQIILADLEASGYLAKKKVGRRNEYTIKTDKKFRHPSESHKSIKSLLEIFE